MATYVNDSPHIEDLGIEDGSPRDLPPQSLSQPQHVPKFYIYAEKGPLGDHFLDLLEQSFTGLYGDETVRINSPYHTHVTETVKSVIATGNSCVIHRVQGKDATAEANATLYADVLEIEVPLYEKNKDGSLKFDDMGEPIAVVQGGAEVLVPGFKVCFILDSQLNVPYGEYMFGARTERPGIQAEGGKQSRQIPIAEGAAANFGNGGNGIAFRLWSPVRTPVDPFPDHLLQNGRTFPFNFAVATVQDTVSGEVRVAKSKAGSTSIHGTLQLGAINPSTGGPSDLGYAVRDNYLNVRPELSSGLGKFTLYYDNIERLIDELYAAESAVTDSHRDTVLDGKPENKFTLNLFGLCSSNGSPYQAIKLVDADESVRLTPNSNLFLAGGSDGEMSLEHLEAVMRADLKSYEDPLDTKSENMINHNESIIYDTGFTLETKLQLPKFISRRQDTFVAGATFIHGQHLSLEEQKSLGITLDTQFALYPESAFYGTPTVRAAIFMGSGELVNSNYLDRVSTTHEIAVKTAKYMGASNGKWKRGELFDKGDKSRLSLLKNVDINWIPSVSRLDFWSAGLNFPQSYDRRSVHFPALRTVYKEPTSIFVSYFVALAAAHCNRISHQVGTEFLGDIELTSAQLEDRVNERFNELAADKFDDIVIVRPDAQVTEEDELKGFSWHLPVHFYGPTMKRVMTTSLHGRRLTDLDQ